ncbi:SWF/SNF family helicase [Actinokineospora auranticolor]|uniref:Putative Zn finger protein n=1 Tax=Actinokineospora auranticolor TaxID=155976 RepID=A0A2S6GJU5_9PSEU|nr:hypothetical protein [Actinokineospora auranticolor]PPK65473.1 putative Zn finger protein [Actinokineospora auranticolor]
MSAYDDDEYDGHLAALFADDEEADAEADLVDPGRRAVAFAPFPPGRRYGKKFADTWWGNAWVEAMEDTALDHERLRKGRAHAFAGLVGVITVSPGRVSAPVHDGDHTRPYATVVRIAELTDAGWDRFLDKVATRAGHIAALLDKDMPRDLVGAASDAGVRLLPDYGDLDPECDCLGWDSPCEHAAALAYQVSWLLDRDPFVLLLVRGRGEAELTAELHRRNTRGTTGDPVAVPGVAAAEAWAAEVADLPADSEPASMLDLLPVLEDVEAKSPVDNAALVALAAAAAERARALLAGDDLNLSQWPDAVRLAAHTDLVERTAARTGRPTDFTRAVHAWEIAGAAGLAALEQTWAPPRETTTRTRAEFEEAWRDSGFGEPPALKVWRNRWTVESKGIQLRLTQDGRWYPFRADPAGGWALAGTPTDDLALSLVELLRDE